jgi:hypothetical protein
MSWIELIADRKIRDAQEEGAFDNLAGKGKPIDLSADRGVPPEQRLAYRILKDAHFLPDWIELDKDIRTRAERLEERIRAFSERHQGKVAGVKGGSMQQEFAMDAQRDAFLVSVAKDLRLLNASIDRYNLVVPAFTRQKFRLNLEERMEELEAQLPRLRPRRSAEPAWSDAVREDRPRGPLSYWVPKGRRAGIG